LIDQRTGSESGYRDMVMLVVMRDFSLGLICNEEPAECFSNQRWAAQRRVFRRRDIRRFPLASHTLFYEKFTGTVHGLVRLFNFVC